VFRYEVVVTVREDLRERFEQYFRTKHIPEILATGCFTEIRFDRSDTGAFRTVYHAVARADLERYLSEHTARFRADFSAHFPDGVTPTREVWTELQSWDS
jgi:hypothetical protein